MSDESTDVNVEVTEIEQEETTKSTNWWQIGLYVIVGLAITFAVYALIANRGANTELVKERNNVTQLIEERVKLQNQVQELNMQNEQLNASLEIADQDLTAKEIILSRVNKENETLHAIKAQMTELQRVSEKFSESNKELLSLQESINRLIDNKQRENKKLTETLQ